MTPDALAAQWRHEAGILRRRAAAAHAEVLESCAEDLERAVAEDEKTLLTLTEAKDISGYSPDHLRRLVRKGHLTDYGRPHAPRLRKAELPRKPVALPRTVTGPHLLGASRRQIARAVLSGEDHA